MTVSNSEDIENLLQQELERYQNLTSRKTSPARCRPKSPAKNIFLLETHIAGTSYIDGIEELADGLREGERLLLLREPENPHDGNAILVKTRDLIKLGYVPMSDNLIFARLMDAGKNLYCRVSSVEQIDSWTKIEIGIFLKD